MFNGGFITNNEYIASNGIKYYSFRNPGNTMCYFTSALQMLKTSKTLTELLNKSNAEDILKRFPLLMSPVVYYCCSRGKGEIEPTISKLGDYLINDGYRWDWLMTNYYFPIIWDIIKSKEQDEQTIINIFHNILREMSVEKHHLANIDVNLVPLFKYEVDKNFTEAEQEINKAHNFQTSLLQEEAQGKDYQLNLILIHSQDHLMNALTIKDMANEIIDIYQEIKANR